MKEIWRNIKGYDGLYIVSNCGRVKTLHKKGSYPHNKDGILKNNLAKNGYYMVALCKNGKIERVLVHRLVATTFIPNPNNYPVVNHIDENKLNNNVANLEWTTQRLNNIHSKNHIKMKAAAVKKQQKAVLMYDRNGQFVCEFESATIAAKAIGSYQQLVSLCCYGKLKFTKGYTFKFKNQ